MTQSGNPSERHFTVHHGEALILTEGTPSYMDIRSKKPFEIILDTGPVIRPVKVGEDTWVQRITPADFGAARRFAFMSVESAIGTFSIPWDTKADVIDMNKRRPLGWEYRRQAYINLASLIFLLLMYTVVISAITVLLLHGTGHLK